MRACLSSRICTPGVKRISGRAQRCVVRSRGCPGASQSFGLRRQASWLKGRRQTSSLCAPGRVVALLLPGVCGKSARTGFSFSPGSVDLPQSPTKVGWREGGLAREMAASAFHCASLRSRRGATCCRLSQVNSHIANGANMATFSADLAGTVAAMSEGTDPFMKSNYKRRSRNRRAATMKAPKPNSATVDGSGVISKDTKFQFTRSYVGLPPPSQATVTIF